MDWIIFWLDAGQQAVVHAANKLKSKLEEERRHRHQAEVVRDKVAKDLEKMTQERDKIGDERASARVEARTAKVEVEKLKKEVEDLKEVEEEDDLSYDRLKEVIDKYDELIAQRNIERQKADDTGDNQEDIDAKAVGCDEDLEAANDANFSFNPDLTTETPTISPKGDEPEVVAP